MPKNHVLDPLFFYDAVEEFAFDYDWYPIQGYEIDELGRKITKFDHLQIRGSLQPKTASLSMSIEQGSITKMQYDFYCMSKYRVQIGDFICYKNRFLHVDGLNDYDEFGVRSCSLTMINLNDYKDLQEYLKYLNGQEIV